jgi:hypothetical protein
MMMTVRPETMVRPLRFRSEAETRNIEAQSRHETVFTPWLGNFISIFTILGDMAN